MTTTTRPKHPETLANIAAGERFAENTKDHVLTVQHDDGLYKHLLIKAPGSSFYWYEIITWPGCLTISGDMGTWTFRRDTDMLAFFRANPDRQLGHDYRINASYWAEKLQGGAVGGRDSAQEYDPKALAQHLRERVTERAQDNEWPDEVRDKALAALETDLIADFTDYRQSEDTDRAAAYDYEWSIDHLPEGVTLAKALLGSDIETTYKVSFDWDTVYDGTFRSYNRHFLWCLHAIVSGIEKYDAHTAALAATPEPCHECETTGRNCGRTGHEARS